MVASRNDDIIVECVLKCILVFCMQVVKDEVIIDLVEQCRTNHRRVLQLINGTS